MLSQDLMTPLVALAAFMAVGGVGWALAGGGAKEAGRKRARTITQRARMRGRKQSSALDASAQRRKQIQETLKDLEEKQRSLRKRSVSLRAQIEQAGFDFAPQTFWIASAILGACAFAGVMIAGKGPLLAACAGLVFGLGLPRWALGMLRGLRMKKFAAEFANGIDVIVRGVKSGLPLNECLRIIARESPDPLGEEFRTLTEGQAVGVSLEDGLRRMYERMPLSELNFFGVVLAIQQKTGGNLAEALNNLSTVLRSRKMMREKIQALSSEAKASALIIGSLPPGVLAIVYFTTPSYMSLMFIHPLGKMMLLGGLMWMSIGILMMRKMINFKI